MGAMSTSNPENEPQKSSWVPADRSPVPNPGTPYPGSAPSAPYPASAPSASYPPAPAPGYPPLGTPTAGFPPAGPSAYPPAGGPAAYPQGGYSNQPGQPFAPAPAAPKSGFGALFDFSFADYATPSIVKLVYVLTFVVNVLGWLAATFVMFGMGSIGSYYGGGNSAVGVLTLLVGWVPALLNVATMRLALEFYLVTLRTHHSINDIKAGLATRGDSA